MTKEEYIITTRLCGPYEILRFALSFRERLDEELIPQGAVGVITERKFDNEQDAMFDFRMSQAFLEERAHRISGSVTVVFSCWKINGNFDREP